MDFTLSKLWSDMGLFARLIVGVLLVMSLASLFVMAERLIALSRSQRESRSFAARMASLLGGGDLAAAAAEDLGKGIGHLGRVIRAGLKAYQEGDRSDTELTFESVARALERQAQRELLTLRRGQGVLATVGSVAPFVGLLGTVVGIVNAFTSMAKEGAGGLGTVSAGIAEALVTTAFGLLVAIPAVMAFNYLSNWTDGRSVDISESSNELLDLVAKDLRRAAKAG
ncbi:MAG: MotA/TolQ/ExbB proton channel family protein [Polyangiaceae bacterium]|nr:MotA/TolQ/ExbB proton channel family protein [Polyangiaceae bacterium]